MLPIVPGSKTSERSKKQLNHSTLWNGIYLSVLFPARGPDGFLKASLPVLLEEVAQVEGDSDMGLVHNSGIA